MEGSERDKKKENKKRDGSPQKRAGQGGSMNPCLPGGGGGTLDFK